MKTNMCIVYPRQQHSALFINSPDECGKIYLVIQNKFVVNLNLYEVTIRRSNNSALLVLLIISMVVKLENVLVTAACCVRAWL